MKRAMSGVSRITRLILGLVLLSCPLWAQEQPRWVWADIELVGKEPLPSKSDLEKLLPFRLGDPLELYDDKGALREPVDHKLLAKIFQERWPENEFRVSSVWFHDGKTYLVVDVVDPTLEKPPARDFRHEQAPPGEVFALRERLSERRQQLFREGKPPAEKADQGYLDFDDPECALITKALSELVPPLREPLVELMLFHRDPKIRAQAAKLLNWSGDHRANLDAVISAMTDPDVSVRNNGTRYLMAFLSSLTDSEGRRRLLVGLSEQMKQPSHADRNKALIAVLRLQQAWPEDSEAAREILEPTVRRIAKQSVLSNVGAVARELLESWESDRP